MVKLTHLGQLFALAALTTAHPLATNDQVELTVPPKLTGRIGTVKLDNIGTAVDRIVSIGIPSALRLVN
jgi:hypothetical protein